MKSTSWRDITTRYRMFTNAFVVAHPWVLMASIVVASALMGFALIALDEQLRFQPSATRSWLYGGTPESAISLLSAVGSSAITVAGVVFSATFVTMQLASSQYTPRVLQALSDRWYLHIVLGAFLGNFMYSMVVLRSVKPEGSGAEEPFLPVIAVSLSVVYSLVCVGVLIYYITYGMKSLQPSSLIDSAARATVTLLEERARVADEQTSDIGAAFNEFPQPHADAYVLTVKRPNFIVGLRLAKMTKIAEEHDLYVRVGVHIGQYALFGEPLLRIWPAAHLNEATISQLERCVWMDAERRPDQDLEFGVRRVADIMLKALSQAINDPTTAEHSLNRICDLLILISNSTKPTSASQDSQGIARVAWKQISFEEYVHTALGQLRFYIGQDVSLILYTLGMLRTTAERVRPEHRPWIAAEARRLVETVTQNIHRQHDVELIAQGGSWSLAAENAR